jgi:TolB-like protein/Tfp pilus assembly protein PilF
MSETGKAVFLSYASQDAEAAKRICDALRQAGVEVWFDQSELVGGDAWDQKIRRQIKDCALLIPIISAATQARTEGYFRLEWRLADQRTHLMAKGRPFLLPVVIDETRDSEAHVPDSFTEVQWTRLPGGGTTPAFVARVKKLLSGGEPIGGALRPDSFETSGRKAPPTTKPSRRWLVPVIASAVVVVLVLAVSRPWGKAPPPAPSVVAPSNNPAVSARTASIESGSKPEVAALLTRVRVSLARIDTMRTELDTMEGLLGQAAKLDPTDAAVWAEWALLDCRYITEYYDRSAERKDAARRHAAQARELEPTRPDVRLAQAFVMRRLSDDAATKVEAATILRALPTDLPESGVVFIELGGLAFEQNKLAEAMEWLDRAAQIPASAAEAHFEKARFFAFTGEMNKAGPEFDRALAVERAAKILLWKSYILMSWNGDLVAARQTLNEVPPQAFVEDMPAVTRYYLELLSRNYDQALAAVRAVPHDYFQSVAYSGPAGYFKGYVLELAGKPAAAGLERRSALATVERRLAAEPNDRELMVFKALLQTALGDREAGLRTLKAIQELYPTEWDLADQLIQMQLQPENEAFAWAERKVTEGDRAVAAAQLRLDPVYDPIRSDPRFPALLARAEADPRLSPNAKQKTTDVLVAAPAISGQTSTTVASSPSLSPSTLSAADSKSVAVLAFTNLSDDKGNEYFSDGISEELLNVLAKVPGLKVTARTSSFYFKGKEVPVPEIARQLGVAYVVEGSVRKSGDKVRITAQLIKAADGFHVWSDTFTREMKDIFAVQDEIAGLVAQNLEIKMGVMAATQTVDPEAYRLYLEALPAITLRTQEGYDRAEQLLTRAVERDPSLVPAQAALAVVWCIRAQEKGEIGPADSPVAKRIVAQAEMAVRLGPGWAEAQAACGLIYANTFRFAESEQFLRRAVQINPNYAPAHLWLGRTLLNTGRMDEALAELKQATELDPLSHRALDNYAFALLDAGQPKAALGFVERALQIQADSVQALEVKADALAQTGRLTEALAIVDAKRAESVGDLEYTIDVFFLAGRRPELEALLTASPRIRGLDRFYTFAALGRNEEALSELEATAVDWSYLDQVLFSPLLDPIRHNPRFQAKLQAAGLADYHARAQAWRAAHPPEKPGEKK